MNFGTQPILCLGGPLHGRLFSRLFLCLAPIGYQETTFIYDETGDDREEVWTHASLTTHEQREACRLGFMRSGVPALFSWFDTHEQQREWYDWMMLLAERHRNDEGCQPDRCLWPLLPVTQWSPDPAPIDNDTTRRQAWVRNELEHLGHPPTIIGRYAQVVQLWKASEGTPVVERESVPVPQAAVEDADPIRALWLHAEYVRHQHAAMMEPIYTAEVMVGQIMRMSVSELVACDGITDDATDAVVTFADDFMAGDICYVRYIRNHEDNMTGDITCTTNKMADYLEHHYVVRISEEAAQKHAASIRYYAKGGYLEDLKFADKLRRAHALRSVHSEAA